ncbi:hypothetical protein HY251_18515, partial [bacterium]|nr:hypothetical protein [bacterium]
LDSNLVERKKSKDQLELELAKVDAERIASQQQVVRYAEERERNKAELSKAADLRQRADKIHDEIKQLEDELSALDVAKDEIKSIHMKALAKAAKGTKPAVEAPAAPAQAPQAQPQAPATPQAAPQAPAAPQAAPQAPVPSAPGASTPPPAAPGATAASGAPAKPLN